MEDQKGGYGCPISSEDGLTLTHLSNIKKPSPSLQVTVDHAGKCASHKQEKTGINRLRSLGQVKSPAMNRAEAIQSSLELMSRSFIKLLVRSHVSSCFWMGLPKPFCRLHLPKDTTVILEDQNKEQFEVNYFAQNSGLSGGWRNFAIGHKLLEGDVLVFHLVGPTKFKVYILRANDFNEVSGPGSLSNCDSHAKQNETEKKEKENCNRATYAFKFKKPKPKRPKSFPLTVVQKKKRTEPSRAVPHLGPRSQQSGDESEDIGSEVFAGPELSASTNALKDIKSFEDFQIMVNGLCLDNELDAPTQIMYYDLCKCRNAILHEHILPGLNSKLVAGTIREIVIVADAIRACKSTTSRDEFGHWEKSLESFALLGFNVEFLSDRVCGLLRLAFESDGVSHGKRYIEARIEQARTKEEASKVEEEICNLKSKLVELKEAFDKMDGEIQSLKSKAEMYERKFEEQANAPW